MKQPTQVTYRVNLTGTLWQGCESAYSYNFDHLPTADEINRGAGDFESVNDYEVIEVKHSGSWTRETTKRRVVKRWNNEESLDQFLDCTGQVPVITELDEN